MSATDGIVTLLDTKVAALERRVAVLEDKLRRAPGEACPRCGAWDYRVAESKPAARGARLGYVDRKMVCSECRFSEPKWVKPA